MWAWFGTGRGGGGGDDVAESVGVLFERWILAGFLYGTNAVETIELRYSVMG